MMKLNSEQHGDGPQLSSKSAWQFVILIGAVSLFGDMTYEAARSINGPFLAFLGAGAVVVSVTAGFGELVGYGLRLFFGYLCDRTGRYWAITLTGYGINLLAVPLLALAGNWPMAASLMICERLGKAVRTPARDAMLSHAGSQVGTGWAFGLHEALDQIGAVSGPLIVAAVMFYRGENYPLAYAVLAIPAILALGLLVIARIKIPDPRNLECVFTGVQTAGMRSLFWLYLVAAASLAAGFADFPLIAYHFHKTRLVSESTIPLFYATPMASDALAALFFGRLFDRRGMFPPLIIGICCSTLFAPLVFFGSPTLALLGMALWGIGMGMQESVLRAAIARMAPPERRGSAYGIFNTVFGISWFLGSFIMGMLYNWSIAVLAAFSVGAQLLAIGMLILTLRR